MVAVTHDRYFLDNVAGWILELDRGRGIPWEGNYSSWLDQKQKRLVQEEKQETARQRTLERELEWIRQSPRARQAKSKARITAYESLVAQAKEQATEQVQISIAPGPRLGNVVIDADHVKKGYGDQLLVEDLTFKLPPGGIVGVIGPNGAGKTTLFRMIVGQEKPDGGALRLGETVKLGYVDQSRDSLGGDKTVWEEISDGLDVIEVGTRKVPSRAYVAGFNFKGSDQQKKVGVLSGGERNRVHLAKMLKSAANVLLLDEPTNDLDVDTLRALEDALIEFPGCVVVISPRPLVPRPHRHPHAGLRRRQQRRVVRGQLPGLRGGPQTPPRRRGRPAPPHQVQAADAELRITVQPPPRLPRLHRLA